MRTQTPEAEQRNRRIVDAVRKGRHNYSSAARAHGVSRQYVQQVCREHGVESPYKVVKATRTRQAGASSGQRQRDALAHAREVERHYDEGTPLREIAERFNVTEGSLKNFVSRWRRKGLFTKRRRG